MKTLILVTAVVLFTSNARADDTIGILAALQNPTGALADILRPEPHSSLTPLGEKITQLSERIRETRSIEVSLSNPIPGDAGLALASSK